MQIVDERISGATGLANRVVERLGGLYGETVGVDHRSSFIWELDTERACQRSSRDGVAASSPFARATAMPHLVRRSGAFCGRKRIVLTILCPGGSYASERGCGVVRETRDRSRCRNRQCGDHGLDLFRLTHRLGFANAAGPHDGIVRHAYELSRQRDRRRDRRRLIHLVELTNGPSPLVLLPPRQRRLEQYAA